MSVSTGSIAAGMIASGELLFQVACGHTHGLSQLQPDGWPGFYKLALEDGIAGLVYLRCVEAGIELPASVHKPLQQAYRQIADENFRAWKRLERLLSDLAARDLSLVIMPGAALMALYPDPGCRAMDDIDVLIQPGQTAHVKECLAQSGFAPVERHDELYFDNDLVVDLHEDLMNATRVKARRYIGWMEPADVWRSRHSQVIEGVQVETMDSEDMLIFTAVHALKHSFKRLTWLIDLYLLTQKVNWQIVACRAEQYGFKRLLDYSLVLLQTRLGAVLPPAGQQRCAELVLSTNEQRLLNRVFEQRRYAVWGDLLLALSVRGTRKRAIFLAETYFPRPQVLLQVFPYMPKVLFPLAYGLRLTQVLLVGLRHLARLVRRR